MARTPTAPSTSKATSPASPPTGNYSVADNGTVVALCTALPLNTTCLYGDPPNFLPVGNHALTVLYLGDTSYLPSSSQSLNFTVVPDLTTATLTSSVNPSLLGQTVTFTAQLAGNYATPTGTVSFLDGTAVIGSATLDITGLATFSTSSLAVGTHPITAVYAATLDFNAATSNTVNQVVATVPLASAITLTSVPNPSGLGAPVTFLATISVPGQPHVVPSGSISFFDGTSLLGTSPLDGHGAATFLTSTLTLGSHAITASYAGGNGSAGIPVAPVFPPAPVGPHYLPTSGPVHGIHPLGATQAPVTIAAATSLPQGRNQATAQASAQATAQPGPNPIAPSTSPILTPDRRPAPAPRTQQLHSHRLAPVPVSTPTGVTAVLLVNVQASGSFNQPVALTCSGLPQQTACVFVESHPPRRWRHHHPAAHPRSPPTPAESPPGPTSSAASSPPQDHSPAEPGRIAAATLFAGLLLFGLRRRRRLPRLLAFALVSLVSLTLISGCGNCTNLGTLPGSYSFTVTGTRPGRPLLRSPLADRPAHRHRPQIVPARK